MEALSVLVGLAAAVVDGEFFEIGEDGERQLGAPGVAAQLVSRADILFDVDGGLLGFDEEFARPADAEGVIGGLGGAADLDGVLVDDIFVGLGVVVVVEHVPAEGLEEGVEELAAQLGFVVVWGEVRVTKEFEIIYKLENDIWSRHWCSIIYTALDGKANGRGRLSETYDYYD